MKELHVLALVIVAMHHVVWFESQQLLTRHFYIFIAEVGRCAKTL